jgi:CHAT domain-containing protein
MDDDPALLKSILPGILKNVSLLLQPVSQWMKEKSKDQAILITDGMLSLLPLIPADNSIIYSLIPSAYFLDACMKRSENFKTPKDQARMVLIQNPSTSLAPLEFSLFETAFLQKLFKPGLTKILKESEPVLENVTKEIRGADHIHFSCHGVFSSTDPLNSSLVLANNENLTLANILDGELGFDEVKLCVLSACQTSLSDFDHTPDEVVGFPGGLLESGCMGVLGSIWSVNDLSTALLMGKFYELYLADNSENNSARALTKAQQWLKNVTNGNLADLFMEYSNDKGAEIAKLSKAQFEKFARNDPYETPFAHPYYWAAFNFYGI